MDAMPHVQLAASLATETCKSVFKYHRWNCSSIDKAPVFTPDLTRGNKKFQFVFTQGSVNVF